MPGRILSLIQNRAFQTLFVLVSYCLLAKYLPYQVHQGFYTASVLIKDLLLLIMPFAICIFIAGTIRSFERKAPVFILTIFIMETLSNTACVWYGFFGGSIVTESITPFATSDFSNNFTVLWRLPLVKPAWWAADKGAFAGLVIGSIAAFYYHNKSIDIILNRANRAIELLLTKVFSRLIPIFILGFVASIYQMNLLEEVVGNYDILILWLIFLLIIYISCLFFIGANFSPSRFITNIKNLTPAGVVAVTSSCSLSTMPWTIEGASKNLNNPSFARAIIPATTNIQQVGDCITNSFLCFIIYNQFYGHAPDLIMWAKFSVMFVLARFATAAVLGGAIFVVIPIYENYLDFSSEMIAIILALNVILDPIVTTSNVLGNGSMCRIFEIVWASVQKVLSATMSFKKETRDVL